MRRIILLILLCCGVTGTAHAQIGVSEDPGQIVSLGRIAAAVVLCCLVAVGMAVLIKRGGIVPAGGRSGARLATRFLADRAINVVESRRLSPHADLCLVEWNDRQYLLLCGAGSSLVVDQSVRPTQAAPDESAGADDAA